MIRLSTLALVLLLAGDGWAEIKSWRVGDGTHPWILRPVSGRLELGRSWAVELLADDDGDGLIDEDPVDLIDNDDDGSINEDPVDPQVDNDNDGLLNEDEDNNLDDDGDGLIDEDPPELIDNDLDGLIDEDGPDPQIDNDGDGLLNEDGLYSRYDDDWDGLLNEDPVNGVDDDGDGLVDEDPDMPDHGGGVTTWIRPIRLDSLRNLAYMLNQRYKAGEFGGVIPGKDTQRPYMVVPSEYGIRREVSDPVSGDYWAAAGVIRREDAERAVDGNLFTEFNSTKSGPRRDRDESDGLLLPQPHHLPSPSDPAGRHDRQLLHPVRRPELDQPPFRVHRYQQDPGLPHPRSEHAGDQEPPLPHLCRRPRRHPLHRSGGQAQPDRGARPLRRRFRHRRPVHLRRHRRGRPHAEGAPLRPRDRAVLRRRAGRLREPVRPRRARRPGQLGQGALEGAARRPGRRRAHSVPGRHHPGHPHLRPPPGPGFEDDRDENGDPLDLFSWIKLTDGRIPERRASVQRAGRRCGRRRGPGLELLVGAVQAGGRSSSTRACPSPNGATPASSCPCPEAHATSSSASISTAPSTAPPSSTSSSSTTTPLSSPGGWWPRSSRPACPWARIPSSATTSGPSSKPGDPMVFNRIRDRRSELRLPRRHPARRRPGLD